MPDAVLAHVDDLESKTTAELELLQKAMYSELNLAYKSFEEAPPEKLHKLLAITRMLRRKTSGPPKTPREKRELPKMDAKTLLSEL